MQSMERSTRSSRRDANSASALHAGPQHDSGQFLCIDCNKTFDSKLQLTSHKQSHTAKKPYVCTHCGRGFHHQVFLQMHERSHEHGSPRSQTPAAKPSPSRVISTRSCKVVAPVEEDKAPVADPPSKHDPSGTTMVEFRKEKPTHRTITPVECVTRLTRGKAPALYQQSDDPEKSPFGFRISKFSDTTVHLMDAFGNSIELLTEVFNMYASSEPADSSVLSGQTRSSPHHPGQSDAASPGHEGSCRNGLRDSAASPVGNGVSRDSVADVAPALTEDGQNDDSRPSAAVKLSDSSQENCEATTGHQEGLRDLLEERTSPPMSEPDQVEAALDEQMETVDGVSGNCDTNTSALVAHPAAATSAPDPASSAHEDATENTSKCDGNTDILLSDDLPAAAAVEPVGQSVETQNMSSGDGEVVSSEAVSVSQEENVHKDDGFLETDAPLTSDTATQLVSPTSEQDNPDLHAEARKGIDDPCEPNVFNEGQQKIPSETTAEPRERSECIDIARSASNTVNTDHTSTLTCDDQETARPDDCEAAPSPATDLTKGVNDLESESSKVSLPQNESELDQQVSDSNEPDPDSPQQPELCERDQVAEEPGGSAGDEAELPDKPESLQQESNGSPNQSIAPSEPPAEAVHETSPQALSEGGAGENHQEPEGANTDHISPSAESMPKSPSVPDCNLSHQTLTDAAISQGDKLPDQTGNPHLLIGSTEGGHVQPPEQLNVQGPEAEKDKEEHSKNPDQMTVRGGPLAETVPGSDASNRDIVQQESGEEESEILSNEDHVGSHEENLKPVLVTEQEITNEVSTSVTECVDEPPGAKPSPAGLSPEEDGSMDAVTPSAQVVYPEESLGRNLVTPHVESKDSDLSPHVSDPESSQDHPTIEEPKHLVPADATDQAPLDVHTTEDESVDQSTTDPESKGLLSSSTEPFDQSQKDLMEGEPGGVAPQTQTESSAASSLSEDGDKDVLDNDTTSMDPDASAEPSTKASPCEELASDPPAIAVTGPASNAKEDVSATSPCQPPADQASDQEKKLEMSTKPLPSPKSKLHQAISEMSVYCMSGKLLTVGAKCLLCDQKLRTYRGEISSPICRKCRLSRKKGDLCFGTTDLSPHSLSSLERNLLTKASPCNIKKEVLEVEDCVKPLDSGEAEAETAAKKMYKCHKCDKSFSLPALLAGHVKFHSLPKCLTCGRPMRLRYRVRLIPRNCRVCTKKLKDKKQEEGTSLLNESSDEGKSEGEWLSVSQASLHDDKDDPKQPPHGVRKYKPRTHKVAKAKLSARKFRHTRRVGKKAAVSVGASKRRGRAPLKSPSDGGNASVKPYKCTKCPVAFKRPIYLVKHMRKHLPSAPHAPFTVLKGSPHHSDSDEEQKSLASRDLLGRRPGDKPVLRRKRQKQGLDESAKPCRRRPAKKPRMSKPDLSLENSEEMSSDGYSVGNPCQVLNQGEGSRTMTPFGGLSAKEELDETPISQQNECKEEGALSDSSTNSQDASTSGDKPHVCQHCGKCFQYYRSLHLHVLVHTAVQCESCGCRLRFKKRAGRRSKKCRLCRLQEKEQAFELQLPAATKKPVSLGKARTSALLPPNKKPRTLKSVKGQSLAELKQISKGMKQLLVKGLARKPRKQKANAAPLPVVGRKKKARDLLESDQLDPSGGDHQGSGLAASTIKLEDGTFTDSAGKVMFVSTMKMKRAKGLVTENQAAGEETQEPLSDQTSVLPLASDKPSLRCSVCDQDFESQELLFAHMQSHAAVLLFSCPQCPHRFHRKQLLKIHLLTHIKDRPHRCPDCNKSFTRINHLNMHRRVHMGIRPYACPDCPSSFRHKVSLLVHRYSHAKVLPIDLKPYQCAYCAKRFLRSDHLEVHQRFHTGECPFQCPDCDKTFPSKARLSIHSRVHSGVRPHVCPTCQRSFIHKANLERHLQKHTGEMAFSCGKCDVRFPSLIMLAQHKHTHRREEVFSCVHCAKRFLYKKSLLKHQDVCQGNKKGKLADGQARGIKRKRKMKEQPDSAEPGVKKRRPRLKKNVTSTKPEREGKPLKMRKIKKETLTEEEKDQGTPNENPEVEQNETEKGKKKPVEGKPVKVRKIKKEKVAAEEEEGQETSKESVKPEENEKGKKKPLEEKTLKVKKIRKNARTEERQEDLLNESGTNKAKKKQTEGTRPKTDGKQEKVAVVVRAKKKSQKEGVKLKTQESVKSKKSSEGPKQGEDKPKNSRLGVKRGPYKKRVKLGAPGEKKKIVKVKVKSVQVKLKPGPKKKQGMKEKKEKV